MSGHPDLLASILMTLLAFSIIILSYEIEEIINPNNFLFGQINAEKVVSTAEEPVLSESLQGTIVGGIIGFISAILVDTIKTWRNRPILEILEATSQKTFNYNRHSIAAGVNPDEFTATRIKIENSGETAAENCKATLIINEDEYRIAWMIPRDDLTATINAHDTEFVDLCAVTYRKDIWIRIFTTERGYGKHQKEGRVFQNNYNNMIRGQLKISSKNSKTRLKPIWISDHPDDSNRIVYFHDPY